MTVAQLLASISSRELIEWRLFFEMEPVGERRQDLHAAQIVGTLANIHRGKNQPPIKLSECLLNFDPPKQQSLEDIKAVLLGIVEGTKQ
jgi:hypothetical protein